MLRGLVATSTSVACAFAIASPGRAGEPPDDAVLAAVPFEDYDEPNRVVIDLAKPGGRSLSMMLDTGATFSVMTPRFARELGVSVRARKQDPYRRATALGRDLQFYVDTSSSDTGSRTGSRHGLIGGNFLEEYVVELDFESRRVRFLDAQRYEVPERVSAGDEAVVPLRITSGRPFVEIAMNGRSLPVLIDTGAPHPMILSGEAARELGIDVDALAPFGELGSSRGPVSVELYETESFAFGGFRFAQTPVIVAPKGAYNLGGNTDSVVGYDVLSQFTLRIDYPRRRLWLRRHREDVTYLGVDYALTRDAGLFLYPSGPRYVVHGVVPGSPAARIGLRSGDVLYGDAARPLALTDALDKVRGGEPMRVGRRTGQDWSDVVLPEGATLPGRGGSWRVGDDGVVSRVDEPDREALRDDAARRDATSAERFERRKREALYYRTEGGGWMRVPENHRRRGPRAGETWVSYDEMQAIRSAEPAGADD